MNTQHVLPVPLPTVSAIATALKTPDGRTPVKAVGFGDRFEGQYGAFCFEDGALELKPQADPYVVLYSLFHELGHALLHTLDDVKRLTPVDVFFRSPRYMRLEVEAESVAAMTFIALGLTVPKGLLEQILLRTSPLEVVRAAEVAAPAARQIAAAFREVL